MKTKQEQASGNVLAAYFLITLAVTLSNGHFTVFSFFITAAGLSLLWLPCRSFPVSRKNEMRFLRAALVLFSLLILFKMNAVFFSLPPLLEKFRHLRIEYASAGKFILLLLPGMMATASFFYAVLIPLQKKTFLFFAFMCLLYLAAASLALCVFYDPPIDVYDMLMAGGEAFRKGRNPYAMQFANLYYSREVQTVFNDPIYHKEFLDFFSYFPGVLPFAALGSLWGDARFAFLLFHFGFSLVLFLMADGGERGALWAALSFINPVSLHLLLNAYIDPLLAAVMALSVFCLLKRKRLYFAILAGYMISIKQYSVLLIPLFFKFSGGKMFLVVMGTFLLAVFPFFIVSPEDFIHDAVRIPLHVPPRADGLTLWAFFHHYGMTFHGRLYLSLFVMSLFFILPARTTSPGNTLLHAGRLYALLFLLSNYAFINYYYFALSFLPLSQLFHETKDRAPNAI